MIYVLILNHKIKYELSELIKVFFPGKEIIFIDKQEDYSGEGILIISSLCNYFDNPIAKCQLYIDNTLISQSIENIKKIEIYRAIENTIKIGIKKSIYDCLIDKSENLIPWGILTGIRPVKIVHDLIDKNIDEDEIIRVMNYEYKLNTDKAKLIMDIAKRQRKYVYPLSNTSFSLYIGIPFCPTRCLYCSFPSLPVDKYSDYINEYVSNVIHEIDSISDLMNDKKINAVYIGGGTPTSIPSRELERIIQSIYNRFGEENINEFTVEAGRPDTITVEYLTMLNKNHIKRISINPQTMNNDTLKLIGRQHKAEDIIKKYYLAKEIGFSVINMDLIVGLPQEGIKEIQNTLEEIKKLNPENLTVHTLSVKRGSKFKDTYDKYSIQSQCTIGKMLDLTVQYSKDMGLNPYYLYRQKQILGNYENVGYSRPNMDCIYNILMMEEKETIMAAGMGAVSKVFFPGENRIERVPNFKDLKEYNERIDELILNKEKALNNINKKTR